MKLSLFLVASLTATIGHAADIVVTSKLPVDSRKVGSSVDVIDIETLENTPYSSLSEVLQSQPSVSTTNSGGIGRATSLRIRGEESYRTRVYIDGIRIEDVTAPQTAAQFQHILLNNVERIEILKGPQGLVYGADSGGVVAIETLEPELGLHGSIDIAAGRYDLENRNVNLSYGSERGSVSISAIDFKTDGFNTRSDDLTGETDGYENTTAHIKARYQLSDAISVSAVYRDAEADDEFDACGFPSTNDCVGFTNENLWRLAMMIKGESSLHTIGFSDTSIDRNTFTSDSPSFDTQGNSQLFEYVGQYDVSQKFGFLLGLELYKQDAKTFFAGFESDLDEQKQRALYGELQFNPTENWFATAGVRYDDNDTFGEHASYRLTSAYLIPQATGEFKLRASAGTGFRAPSLFETSFSATPPASEVTLQEETSKGFDLGVSYQSNNGLFAGVTYFDQRIDDEIFFDLDTFSGYLQAEGESRSKGVELATEWAVIKPLVLTANATYNKAQNRDSENRVLRPRRELHLGANYRFASLASVNLQWHGAYDITGIDQQPLEDYKLLDASVFFYPNDYLTLYAKGNNLLDEDYEQVRNFNTSGRAFTFGVKAEF